MKPFLMVLNGLDFYCYKKDEERHKTMHCLIGTFVQSLAHTELEVGGKVYYPFRLIFPINKVRFYYCLTKEERDIWVNQI